MCWVALSNIQMNVQKAIKLCNTARDKVRKQEW